MLFVGLYASLMGLACLSYRAVLFPAPRDANVSVPAGGELLRFAARDGVEVHALYLPAPVGAPVVVHFHGNGETIGDNVARAEALHHRGLGLLLVEYRGYGVSRGSGEPSEQGLYLDADAALDELGRRGIGADRVVLWGTSLGTGVAVEMAVRARGARLVLVSPYTSIPRMAARYAPFLPMNTLVTDRFDTLSKAPRVALPALVIHGDHDEVVPYGMGREVAAALPNARLVTVIGGHHNDLFAVDGVRLVDALVAHAFGR